MRENCSLPALAGFVPPIVDWTVRDWTEQCGAVHLPFRSTTCLFDPTPTRSLSVNSFPFSLFLYLLCFLEGINLSQLDKRRTQHWQSYTIAWEIENKTFIDNNGDCIYEPRHQCRQGTSKWNESHFWQCEWIELNRFEDPHFSSLTTTLYVLI